MRPHKKGWLILEALISLIVVALVIHTLTTSLQFYSRVHHFFTQDKSIEWLQFTVLMEKELSHFQIKSITSNTITLLDTDRNQTFEIILRNNKLYKNKGHHPYLYEVEDWFIIDYGAFLYIEVTFTNGQTFSTHILINSSEDIL